MSSALPHTCFCSLLRKGSFKVQYLLNCLTSSHSKNYGSDDLSTDGQADHNWPKWKKIQQLFLVLDSFIILSPELAFSWLGVQKYQPIICADRDSYYYHRLDECISESLLFPWDWTPMPGSHLWIQCSFTWPEMVFRFHGKEWASASQIVV